MLFQGLFEALFGKPKVITPVVTQPVQTLSVASITEAFIWQNDALFKAYAQAQYNSAFPIASDGAIADNRTNPNSVQVGFQRVAIDLINIGVSTANRFTIGQGISAFKWAFDRQSVTGAFGISEYPEVVTFLGSYARSILLLRQAGYTVDANNLAQYVPKMTLSINSSAIQAGETQFKNSVVQNDVTNQLFWAALSYRLIHLVQSNPRIGNQAASWLKQGLLTQKADGSFPEAGGTDTTYHSWSLELLSLSAFYSPSIASLLKPYQAKGFQWLTSKILPDGTMDVSQNTRTGGNQEVNQYGEFKQGKYGRPISYLYWSYLGGGQAAIDTAIRLNNAR